MGAATGAAACCESPTGAAALGRNPAGSEAISSLHYLDPVRAEVVMHQFLKNQDSFCIVDVLNYLAEYGSQKSMTQVLALVKNSNARIAEAAGKARDAINQRKGTDKKPSP